MSLLAKVQGCHFTWKPRKTWKNLEFDILGKKIWKNMDLINFEKKPGIFNSFYMLSSKILI